MGFITFISITNSTMKNLLLITAFLLAAIISRAQIDPITGNSKICTGTSITLADASPLTDSSYSITWRSSDASVATVDTTGIVTGNAAGTATIVYSIGTDSTSVVVNVFDNPVVSAPTPLLCRTGSYTLTSSGTGSWISTATSIAIINPVSGVLNAINPGTVTIENLDSNGCYGSVVITVNPFPAIGSIGDSICGVGSTALLTDTVAGGTWTSMSPGILSVDASGIVTAVGAGYGMIAYQTSTDSGCYATHGLRVYSSGCTSLSGGTTDSVYSPCSNTFELGLTGASSGCDIQYNWQISYDNLTWNDMPGLTSASAVASSLFTAYYRCRVTCSLSGLNVYSNPVQVQGRSGRLSTNVVPDDFLCGNVKFIISGCPSSSTLSASIYYGDHSSDSGALITSFALSSFTYNHVYNFAGTYPVRVYLYDASALVDSQKFDYDYHFCRSLLLKSYFDLNANCIKDSSDIWSGIPIPVEVDSNGVAIDTISFTSGDYYHARGNAGDNYSFRVISSLPGLSAPCPSTLSFILTSSMYQDTINGFGFHSSSDAAYDMSVVYTSTCGRHRNESNIYVYSTSFYPRNAKVILFSSPKYNFTDAYPAPDSVSGNLYFWNLSGITNNNSNSTGHIWFHKETPGSWMTPASWLIPGDTVKSYCVIHSGPGDADTLNNGNTRCDTVKGSWDPNEMEVSPQGYIISGTPLQYTINFENTGNDTAHNIYVLDTLSANVDPNTIQILAASAAMNMQVLQSGGYNIIKFDFPGINLPDTSHRPQCDGMVAFSIRTLQGLPDSSAIYNHAGIYFDENEVVMTDTVQNIINMLYGADTMCIATTTTFNTGVDGGWWTATNSNATVVDGVVNAIAPGLDTIQYTVAYGRDTLSLSRTIFVNPLPDPGSIAGATSLCSGSSVTLSNPIAGGVWTATNASVEVPDPTQGIVTGVSAGTDTIVYTATNFCGTQYAYFVDTVVTSAPSAGVIIGDDTVCAGSNLLLTDAASVVNCTTYWGCSNSLVATVSGGLVSGTYEGWDTVFYAVTNACGTDTARMPINVITYPLAGVLLGQDSLCVGTSVSIAHSMPGGIWSITNNNVLDSAGILTGLSVGLDTVQYSVGNMCGVDTARLTLYILPAMTAGAISGPASVCVGSSVSLSESVSGGFWSLTNATLASIAPDGTIVAYISGTDTAVFQVTNVCGSVSVSQTFNILPLPVAGMITGNDTVCIGGQVTLTDTISAGVWSNTSSNAFVSSAGIVTGITAGQDTIRYKVTNTCGTDSALFPIVVYTTPSPFITSLPPNPLCQGSIVTVTATPFGGAWSLSNDSISSLSGAQITGLQTGVDTLIYTFTDLCGSKQSRSVVNVDKAPTPTITGLNDTLCVYHEKWDTLILTPTGGIVSLSNTNVTVSGNILTAVHEGQDTVLYTKGNTCGIGYDTMVVTVLSQTICDSLEGVAPVSPGPSQDQLVIFPNPSSGSFNIVLTGASQGEIEVTNMYGEVLLRNMQLDAQGKAELQLGALAPGTYVVRIVTAGKIYTGKLVRW